MSKDSNVLGDVKNVDGKPKFGKNHNKHRKGHGRNRIPLPKEGFVSGSYIKLVRVSK
ncbi:MAG: hypothetical protein UZ19_OD1000543 [Parcubacteria bacterium OLB19]|nr:MAG: hypothetical protein UZ19_OD1000543 [Parcubacteria bacterium OLB19]